MDQCETNENTQLAITTKGFSAVCSVWLILAIYHKSIVDRGLKKIQGLIVTTDSFFGKKKIRENIVKNFSDGLASDMEGSSVAQVAHHFKVPYTVLRVISDEATDGAGFTFDEVIDEIGDEVGKILINYFESLS